jgi:predicted naringenin-chalcone synthase
MSKIISIGTAVPKHRYSQSTILEFMLKQHHSNTEETKSLSNLYAKSGIDYRHSVIPDFNIATKLSNLFTNDVPNIETRLELYYQHALPLALDAVSDCLKKLEDTSITHVISVSCTGMMAPGLDIELVRALQLNKDTERTAIQFLGCYAAMHALKQAHYICATNKTARVLIVCVELCTLHFQNSTTRDNLLSNAIFADGAAAALICNDQESSKPAIALHQFYSRIDFNGFNDMGWYIKSNAFQMRLTSQIPAHIKTQFKQLVEEQFLKSELQSFPKEVALYDWAIHPGGKKILDVIEEDFELNSNALIASRHILNQNGNMSSPTILFILKELLLTPQKDKPLLIAAFGPGLTSELAFAKYV